MLDNKPSKSQAATCLTFFPLEQEKKATEKNLFLMNCLFIGVELI